MRWPINLSLPTSTLRRATPGGGGNWAAKLATSVPAKLEPVLPFAELLCTFLIVGKDSYF